jgi:anti-sigma factor RsiW
MMRRPSDETLIAYLDGELDGGAAASVARALEDDPRLRERAARLAESAALLRAAFDDVLHEPLPERLVAAARGAVARPRLARIANDNRWRAGVAAALVALVVGVSVGYFAGSDGTAVVDAGAGKGPSPAWIENLAGYHKLFVAAGNGEAGLADVPAGENAPRPVTQKLPEDIRPPDLKPWGLAFQGARFIIVEGKRATQLFYSTDKKDLGPVTLVIAPTAKPDTPSPVPMSHDDVNVLYWRHNGRAYYIVGSANLNYLWNLHKDIAFQLDGI